MYIYSAHLLQWLVWLFYSPIVLLFTKLPFFTGRAAGSQGRGIRQPFWGCQGVLHWPKPHQQPNAWHCGVQAQGWRLPGLWRHICHLRPCSRTNLCQITQETFLHWWWTILLWWLWRAALPADGGPRQEWRFASGTSADWGLQLHPLGDVPRGGRTGLLRQGKTFQRMDQEICAGRRNLLVQQK